jgi:hypothetical protein
MKITGKETNFRTIDVDEREIVDYAIKLLTAGTGITCDAFLTNGGQIARMGSKIIVLVENPTDEQLNIMMAIGELRNCLIRAKC